MSSRAHPDGDTPLADAQDHATRLRSRPAGGATAGRHEAGLSVPPAGQPAGAAQSLPVPPPGASRRIPAAGQRSQLCHPKTLRYPYIPGTCPKFSTILPASHFPTFPVLTQFP